MLIIRKFIIKFNQRQEEGQPLPSSYPGNSSLAMRLRSGREYTFEGDEEVIIGSLMTPIATPNALVSQGIRTNGGPIQGSIMRRHMQQPMRNQANLRSRSMRVLR